jgi:hypothetical protein
MTDATATNRSGSDIICLPLRRFRWTPSIGLLVLIAVNTLAAAQQPIDGPAAAAGQATENVSPTTQSPATPRATSKEPKSQEPKSQEPTSQAPTSQEPSSAASATGAQPPAATVPLSNAAGERQPTGQPSAEQSDGVIDPLSRRIRRIFFYESQAPKLVPSSFWPVGIDDLEAALNRQSVSAERIENRPTLASAVYVARFERQALISDAESSSLDITYRDDAPGVLPLGQMNLAIESQAADGLRTQTGRLVSQGDGTVRAIVYKDCRLRFGWSRRGTPAPGGRCEFDLEIPRCGRTRFVVGLPVGANLESIDGVVIPLPSPPPEARSPSGDSPLAWFSIEAGGLRRIRLTVIEQEDDRTADQRYSLRKIGLDAVARPLGLEWTMRMVVDVPRGSSLPNLLLTDGGRITAIRVNNRPVRWEESTAMPGGEEASSGEATRIRFDGSSASLDSLATANSLAAVIEVNGTVGDLRDPSNVTQLRNATLPWLRIESDRTTIACAESETLLRVGPELQIAQWSDRANWRIEQVSADGESAASSTNLPTTSAYRLTGPPTERPPAAQFVTPQPMGRSISSLRLTVAPDGLRAQWDASIDVGNHAARPYPLEIQPGWQIANVTMVASNRVIELRDQQGDGLTLWPEPSDVVGGKLRVRITGTRLTPEDNERLTVPMTWFVRNRGAMLDSYSVVIPPADYEWSAGTALRGETIDAKDLPEFAAQTLLPLADDALVFATHDGAVPDLELDRPPAAFNSEIDFELWIDGDEIVERLRIGFKVPAGRLPAVQLHLGDSLGRPPMRWSVVSNPGATGGPGGLLDAERITQAPALADQGPAAADQGPALADQGEQADRAPGPANQNGAIDAGEPLASAAEARGDHNLPVAEHGDEAWRLSPRGGIRDGLVIVGERRYSMALLEPSSNDTTAPWFPLPLLPVSPAPQGSSHRATVAIGPRIDLLATRGEVLRIPRTRPNPAAGNATYQLNKPAWMLRYDPSDQASMQLRPHPRRDAPPVIWYQGTDVISGTSGDEIAVEFRIDGDHEIEVTHEPTMTVTGVEGMIRDVDPVRPGRLRLSAMPDTDVARVFFWRPSRTRGPLRGVEAPRIEVNGFVMRQVTSLWAAADSIALVPGERVAPPAWVSGGASAIATNLADGGPVWLISNGFGWALAGSVAILAFGIGWGLAFRVRWLVAIVMTAAVVVAVVLPNWNATVMGFVITPLAAAGLLATSLGRGWLTANRLRHDDDRNAPASSIPLVRGSIPMASTETHQQMVIPPADDASGRRAGSSRSWIGLFLLALSTWALISMANREVLAVDEGSDPADKPPIQVMIPVDADGSMAGDKVYVPKSLYDLLFRPATSQPELGTIRYQSGEYDVRLSSSGMRDVGDSVVVEAVWRIEIESATQPVRLPIDPATLDRLEVIVDSVPNEIRPQPDGQSIIIRPPKAGVNVLRATMTPQVETTVAGAGRIELSIPAISAAAVTVTSDTPLDQINLPRCLGQISRFEAGSRFSASVGPVDSLELIWQKRGAQPSETTAGLRRRWWIYATRSSVCRELELDVGKGVRSGVIVELIGEPQGTPLLTSSDWMIAASDGVDPLRNRLRMVAAVESPGPIRLIWCESATNLTDTGISIPDVRPAAQSGVIETWIAADIPEGWRITRAEATPRSEANSNLPADRPIAADAGGREARVAPAADQIDPSVPTGSLFEPLEEAEFAAAWRGSRGSIDFAARHPGPGKVTLRIAAQVAAAWTADVRHRVIVTSDQLRLQYVARLTPGTSPARPVSLRLPEGFQIERLSINGQTLNSVSAARIDDGNTDDLRQTDLLLPPLPDNSVADLELIGTIRLSANREFEIPKVAIEGLVVQENLYYLSRSDGIRVRELQEPEGVELIGAGTEYDLTAGTVPLRSWRLLRTRLANSAGDSLPGESEMRWDGGRFGVSPIDDSLAATSLTTLRWDDGVWTVEYDVEIENFAGLTDFLTFQIPSRWIERLDVQPANKWSTQPSTDPNSHLVRVLPQTAAIDRLVTSSDAGEAAPRKLRLKITSQLENAGDGGVAVPQFEFLGGGPRSRFFAVPKRLTSNPIIWQVLNARTDSVPAFFSDAAPSLSTHTIYEAIGDTFSATLQTAPVGNDSPSCPLVEYLLFAREPKSQTSLGLMRIYLLPGDRDHMRLQIPAGSNMLGAWAAGTPIATGDEFTREIQAGDASAVITSAEDNGFDRIDLADIDRSFTDKARIVRMPLGLSRLADQVVVLFSIKVPVEAQTVDLPMPLDLSVAKTWVASFDNRGLVADIQPSSWSTPLDAASGWLNRQTAAISAETELGGDDPREYRREVIDTILALLTDSIDAAAERPTLEKYEWLRPWFLRLRDLGWVPPSGAPSGQQDAVDQVAEGNASADSVDPLPAVSSWAPKFLQRVFGTEVSTQSLLAEAPNGTWLLPPPAWTATRYVRFAEQSQTPLRSIPIELIPHSTDHPVLSPRLDNGLWGGMVGLLGMFVLVGLFGSRALSHPSTWLLVLGCVSIGLAPLPVSISAIVLALVAPLWPSK